MKYVILSVGLLVAFGVGFATSLLGYSSEIALTAAVVVLCAIWWVFEPIPIPATSLIPLAVFPVGGVLTAEQLGSCVGHPLVLLMMGGFMLAVMLARSVFAGHFEDHDHFGFEAASWYWHFVDVVWVMLFLFVYIL